MLPENITKYSNVIISTGNVLNAIKKAGQKPTEELVDSIQSTFSNSILETSNSTLKVLKQNDDLIETVKEYKRNEIKISAKIFLTSKCEKNFQTAIDSILDTLKIEYLDHLIMAYHPQNSVKNQFITNGDAKEDGPEWGGGDLNALNDLGVLWKHLEQCALDKKVEQLGISDLDYNSLKEIYMNGRVKPTIAQINLSTCCVVPPELQQFCNENEIQLLTHSDAEDMLPNKVLENDIKLASYKASWIVRYHVHIKCRGVLTAKGFIVNLDKY